MRDAAVVFGLIGLIWVIGDAIVNIIKASKGGKKAQQQTAELQQNITDLEDELLDVRERVQVLEKIVTDDKHQLNREINNLKEA